MIRKRVIILAALIFSIFSQTVTFGQVVKPNKWNVQNIPPNSDNDVFYGVDFWGIHKGIAVGYDWTSNQGRIITTSDGVTCVICYIN